MRALVLVPEIGLTPQMIRRLKAMFGSRLAVQHSALNNTERLLQWRMIQQGNADIVVGTRSAVFAPLKDIGLIILDEEQEHTYQSESSPRYSAHEVAKKRAAAENALLVFASATPRIETTYAAKAGRMGLVTLRERYGGRPLPTVEFADMRAEMTAGNPREVSARLAGELAAAYIEGVQSQGVGTSIKHFAANNQEHRRLTSSSNMKERTLREIYLPAFETAVRKAAPWTVMCSYNRINGTYASENKMLLTDILRKVASEIFIPLTVGGGINTLEDFDRVLKCGADKVSVNSGAIADPAIIGAAAKKYGDQCVVLSMDVKRVDGQFRVFRGGGRVDTGKDAVAWAQEVERLGAGEILLTSMDCDGTKAGYDLELTRAISEAVSIPVIASGGAGKLEHFYDAFTQGKADAVLAASLFHFREIAIPHLKQYLAGRGVPVRLA